MNPVHDAANRYGLTKIALGELARRHLYLPALVGGGIGAAHGLYSGAKDTITGEKPYTNPLTHPLEEMVRGGVRGAGAGVSANAGWELLRHLAGRAGYHVDDASQLLGRAQSLMPESMRGIVSKQPQGY